jgi:hypothetical protein
MLKMVDDIFLLKMVLGLVRPILLSSIEKWKRFVCMPNIC